MYKITFENASRKELEIIAKVGEYSLLRNNITGEWLVVWLLSNQNNKYNWAQGYYNLDMLEAKELFNEKIGFKIY